MIQDNLIRIRFKWYRKQKLVSLDPTAIKRGQFLGLRNCLSSQKCRKKLYCLPQVVSGVFLRCQKEYIKWIKIALM